MRDIKFRAWDKKSKKMREIDGIAFHNKNSCFDFDSSNLPKVITLWGYDIIEQKDIVLHREEKEVELMQYTGLHDKNGKEIYEGDIVTFEDAECDAEGYHDNVFLNVGQVVYDECTMSYCITNRQTVEMEDLYIPDDVEVIGNIYENPELLQ